MSILLSGDFHDDARGEMGYLTKDYLIKKFNKKLYKEIKYHIILGDGGFLWPGQAKREEAIFETLSERPFPILCVLGNHDPVLGRTDLPEADIGIGEKVIVVSEKKPFLAYLQRGKI
jgi:Icc-related predicted phosphoesterase